MNTIKSNIILYPLFLLLLVESNCVQAQQTCFDQLQIISDKFIHIDENIKKGNMLIMEINSTISSTLNVNKVHSSYITNGPKSIYITDDVEIYSSPTVLIKIIKSVKEIYIFPAASVDERKKEINQIKAVNDVLLKSFSSATCQFISDSIAILETPTNDTAYIKRKRLELDVKGKTLKRYVVTTHEEDGTERVIDTSYPMFDYILESEKLKLDFINVIYEHGKLKPVYTDFKIIDNRK